MVSAFVACARPSRPHGYTVRASRAPEQGSSQGGCRRGSTDVAAAAQVCGRRGRACRFELCAFVHVGVISSVACTLRRARAVPARLFPLLGPGGATSGARRRVFIGVLPVRGRPGRNGLCAASSLCVIPCVPAAPMTRGDRF